MPRPSRGSFAHWLAVVLGVVGCGVLASAQEPAPAALPAVVVEPAAPPTDPALAAEIRRAVDQALKERDEKAKKEAAEKERADEEKAKVDALQKSWDVGADQKASGSWKAGQLTFESPDKAFRMTVGGVTQFDMGWYRADNRLVRSIGLFNNYVDPGQALQDGFDFRRARLRISGTAYEQIEFYSQYEFANAIDLRQRTLGIQNSAGVANPILTNSYLAEAVGFNEVYVGLVKVPILGNVRVGRHRESLNFVTATNDNFQVWMERGLMFDAFNGNYNFSNGVTVARNYLDGRAYTLFGLFQQNSFSNRQFATVGDGTYVYDARLTGLPVWDEVRQLWVHVGVDYSYRNLSQNNVRLRARPDVRAGSAFEVSNLVDTGAIYSRDAQQIMNLELASAFGPWTAAAEATVSTITNAYTGGLPAANGTLPAGVTPRGTFVGAGWYVELLRFLTPDHRPYVQERPGYGRVVPARRFFFLEGADRRWLFDTGAWEVGLRYDYVDLTHGGINGGTARGVTGAVNWYLTSNMRVQWNLSWMRRAFNPADFGGRLDGDLYALGVRFNCDY